MKYPVTTIELSFDGNFFIPDAIHIKGSKQNIMWQKERLINIAIQNSKANKIAWVDADFIFLNENWYDETIKTLDKYKVVQLYEYLEHLDVNGNVYKIGISNMFHHKTKLNWEHVHPGGAWAANKECIKNGLYDMHITGGGDALFLYAVMGFKNPYWLKFISNEWKKQYLEKAKLIYNQVQGNVGYVEGTCQHLWHGREKNRKYLPRLKILNQYDFNPKFDIKINDQGLWEWNTNKKEMHQAVKNYFINRKEDIFLKVF